MPDEENDQSTDLPPVINTVIPPPEAQSPAPKNEDKAQSEPVKSGSRIRDFSKMGKSGWSPERRKKMSDMMKERHAKGLAHPPKAKKSEAKADNKPEAEKPKARKPASKSFKPRVEVAPEAKVPDKKPDGKYSFFDSLFNFQPSKKEPAKEKKSRESLEFLGMKF